LFGMKVLIEKRREFNLETSLAFLDWLRESLRRRVFFCCCYCPTRAAASSFMTFLNHTTTQHSRQSSSGLVISSSQRPLSTWQHTTLITDRHPWPRRDSDGVKRDKLFEILQTKIPNFLLRSIIELSCEAPPLCCIEL
jgi:hypothetical protein